MCFKKIFNSKVFKFIFFIAIACISVTTIFCVKNFNLTKNDTPKPSKEPVHIFYCADDGNALGTCVSIASVLSNADEDENINIHIVHFSNNKMSQKNIDKITKLKKTIKDFNLDFVSFDENKLKDFNTERWNKSIMIKLYAGEIFSELDKILWLDDDTIILRNVGDIYRKDITDKYLAAVDVSPEYNKYANRTCDYWITAGIGLYNLNKIRQDGIQEKLLNTSKKYPVGGHCNKKCCGGIEEYALTHAINKEDILILPYEYSVMAFLHKKGTYDISNVVMLHFAGEKPWKARTNDINENLCKVWDIYCQKTDYVLEDGVYTIHTNLNKNKVLTVDKGSTKNFASIKLNPNKKADNQKFRVKKLVNGRYTLQALNSNKMLTVNDILTDSVQANIFQYKPNDKTTQQWEIIPSDDHSYCVISANNKLYLDVSQAKITNGTVIQCYEANNANAQKFQFLK